MLKLLVKLVCYLLLTLLALGLLKDLYSYLFWRFKYRSQGIGYEYVPFVGLIYYFMVPLHPLFESKDLLKRFKLSYLTGPDSGVKLRQLYEKRADEDIVAINHIESKPYLLLLNVEIIKEFLVKDNDVCCRASPMESPIGMGFLFESGPSALIKRSIMSKFFHYGQFVKLTTHFAQIIQKHVSQLAKNLDSRQDEFPEKFLHKNLNVGLGDGFKSVDMKLFLLEVFSDVINTVLFGHSELLKV